jgi:hypothetical protein
VRPREANDSSIRHMTSGPTTERQYSKNALPVDELNDDHF